MDACEQPVQHLSWIQVAGMSFPVVLSDRKDGTWVATTTDWTFDAEGRDPTEALCCLAKKIDRRIERYIADSRETPAASVGA
jgi:hypothetical protein